MIVFIIFTIVYGLSAFIIGIYLFTHDKVEVPIALTIVVMPLINTIAAISVINIVLEQLKKNSNKLN